jgi:hypothetical protein
MKTIKLSNIDVEIFRDSFFNFQKFVTSNFEFDFDNLELSTSSDDFNKWHLVTLATFYGSDLFRKNNEIIIDEFQLTNINFKIDYNLPKLRFKSNWNDNIEFDPAYLHSADLFLTSKFVKLLSINSAQILKENAPNFNLEQSFFMDSEKYAYFMTDKTLILIKTKGNNATVTHLFKIRWNEI